MAHGFFRHPRGQRGAIFKGLEAEHRATKMLIARVEPTLPAMSLTTNKLKLAERVGFEPDRTF